MDRCVLVAALALAATACGSGPVIGSDDIATFPDASRDATLPRDAGLDADGALDAPLDATDDSTKYVGGPFLCDQCVCDGTVDMCFRAGGGVQPMPLDDGGFGDASACPTDAGPNSCQPIPIDCLLKPSCACILQHHPPPACTCTVDPSGNGFAVDCLYP